MDIKNLLPSSSEIRPRIVHKKLPKVDEEKKPEPKSEKPTRQRRVKQDNDPKPKPKRQPKKKTENKMELSKAKRDIERWKKAEKENRELSKMIEKKVRERLERINRTKPKESRPKSEDRHKERHEESVELHEPPTHSDNWLIDMDKVRRYILPTSTKQFVKNDETKPEKVWTIRGRTRNKH